jgi:hypothetical protein
MGVLDLVQAAGCLGCSEGWLLPDELPDEQKHLFPLPRGFWEQRCPACGGPIWVTEPAMRAEVAAKRKEAPESSARVAQTPSEP